MTNSARIIWVVLAVLGSCFAFTVALWWGPYWDPYGEHNETYGGLLNDLPKEDQVQAVLYHANKSPRYDIGVFGNSRSIIAGRNDLGVSQSFFNFSTPGQSFGNSVRLLSMLNEIGKAPRIAVIQFDHVEISREDNPLVPRSPLFLVDRLNDAFFLLESGRPLREPLVHLYNAVHLEALRLFGGFNGRYLLARLAFHLGPALDLQAHPNYLRDGHRPAKGHHDGRQGVRGHALHDYPLLEKDFAELMKTVREANIKVLVYVSPIYPPVLEEIEANLSDYGKSVRQRFWSLCATPQIHCAAAPIIPDSKKGRWRDYTHAPAGPLGEFISDELAKNGFFDK